MVDLDTWKNHSPGNLLILLPTTRRTPVAPAVEAAVGAFPDWARTPLGERQSLLTRIHDDLANVSDKLAAEISLEIGKPFTEAQGEMGAVLAKFEHAFEDAQRYLSEDSVKNGPHSAAVRHRPRGPAAVVAPFNFPLHLANGAILPHLLAGNTVLMKPSPLAPVVANLYGQIFSRHLPAGVFQIVQGFGDTSRELCLHPAIRSVCFTGSVGVGRQLAMDLAGDFSKDLALELGGKNALFVAADADLFRAAKAAADGVCLTAGQRCNGTSRIFVEAAVAEKFSELFREAMATYVSGDPLLPTTHLGPVISETARKRHEDLVEKQGAEVFGSIGPGLNGHYVLPAAVWRNLGDPLLEEEQFVPFVEVVTTPDLENAVAVQNKTDFGLAASIFTRSEKKFRWFADTMVAGNVYANLPTTFSPSTLPFGGLKSSGNHRPGGKGFARFVADEQALQWTGW